MFLPDKFGYILNRLKTFYDPSKGDSFQAEKALAAIKQKEIDEQVTLGDSDILAVLTKMVKQRQDAAAQYDSAGREDLAQTERTEIVELESFLPQPLTEEEIAALIDEAMASTGANSMQDMGKVMGVLKPQVQGRADMGALSAQIKQRLG